VAGTDLEILYTVRDNYDTNVDKEKEEEEEEEEEAFQISE
jgi:hypothetical protein